MSQATNDSKISFVCCVESGSLEAQTVRLVESLRRWGGWCANAPIFAVTPRWGPPLSRETMQVFDHFGVEYLRHHTQNPYRWFKFLNKPLALSLAESYSQSEAICWLDSDLLFLGEPDQLFLQEGEDFLGCASDKEMGTFGAGDPFEPLWQASCKVLGIEIDEIPWIRTENKGELIRLYWNGGIFVYRRSTDFAKEYLRICTALLEARVGLAHSGYTIGFNEMSAIGFAVVTLGLAWRALPFSHDYIMGSLTHAEEYREEQLRAAKIIHYHDAMWFWFWDEFMDCMQKTHPEIAAWLNSLGPMQNTAPVQWRLLGKGLKQLRANQENSYQKSCRMIH